MALFTLHRRFTLRTTKGHVIKFEKDRPTWVPPLAVHDAIAIGARSVDGKNLDNIEEDEKQEIPMSPQERQDKVFEAFRTMKARNERLDFTASGVPNAKRMPPLLGFEITSRERDDYWKQFHAEELEAQENADAS